jgi:hypothetical protein
MHVYIYTYIYKHVYIHIYIYVYIYIHTYKHHSKAQTCCSGGGLALGGAGGGGGIGAVGGIGGLRFILPFMGSLFWIDDAGLCAFVLTDVPKFEPGGKAGLPVRLASSPAEFGASPVDCFSIFLRNQHDWKKWSRFHACLGRACLQA